MMTKVWLVPMDVCEKKPATHKIESNVSKATKNSKQ